VPRSEAQGGRAASRPRGDVTTEWIDDKRCELNLTGSLELESYLTSDDAAGMEERMDAIRLKQILGEPLTERELMCLQIEQNGFGCHACPHESLPGSSGSGSFEG
jgi:hypothetical protein